MSGSKTRTFTYFDSKGLLEALEEVSFNGRERFAIKVRDTARKSMKPAPKVVLLKLVDLLPAPLRPFVDQGLGRLVGEATRLGIFPAGTAYWAINGLINTVIRENRKRRREIASKPGTPPHKQSGVLQKAIIAQADKESGAVRVALHSDGWYGIVHELGSRKHPKRPFLNPALQKHIDKLPEHLKGDLSQTKAGKRMNRKRSPFPVAA